MNQLLSKIGNWKSSKDVVDIIIKCRKFCLGSILISVSYMDPGNYSSNIAAGSTNRFSLLCVVLLSNLIAVFLQSLCIKLGSVSGLDLPSACKLHLNKYVNWFLFACSECAIIATDLAEVIGTAIALNILMKIPLPAGVILTIVDVLIVLVAYRPGRSVKFIRIIEYVIAIFVLTVVICFCVELKMIPKTDIKDIFRGFVPSKETFQNNGMYTATSILGATVMPHSLILGSSLVKPRLREYDEDNGYISEDWFKTKEAAEEFFTYDYKPTLKAVKFSLKASIIELSITLFTVALFVNCSILIIAGASLYGTPEAADADLYVIYDLLSSYLAPAAGKLFMIALLLSGLMAGIVCTMSGQIVSEGHLNWTIKPWKRRIVTRSVAILPSLVISLTIGKSGLSQALNASQVCLSILLPFISAPLIYFTCKKSVMKVEVKEDYKIDVKQFDYKLNPDMETENFELTEMNIRHRTTAAGASSINDQNIDSRDALPKDIAPKSNASTSQQQICSQSIETSSSTEICDNATYINMANNWLVSIIAVIVWIFICVLNVYMIVELGITGGQT
ncbi:divalent metal ion transporter [Saccharomycopsis crataegensis]|uniref:Divalent metal ion transporter n=1 Tax=Saccharomycopsis crataegensis TaxID=43959 RepID=A0AAV5QGX4_9ASCO|nr:divalent metal ion transporter [Saccharomycopsis crataegensis]